MRWMPGCIIRGFKNNYTDNVLPPVFYCGTCDCVTLGGLQRGFPNSSYIPDAPFTNMG